MILSMEHCHHAHFLQWVCYYASVYRHTNRAVLYYFQHCSPTLFTDTFSPSFNRQMQIVFFSDVKKISSSVLSQFTVGKLVYGFFEFYSKFDFNQIISLLPLEASFFIEPAVLVIIDPVNKANNLSRSVTMDGLTRIKEELQRAKDILDKSSNFLEVVELVEEDK